MYDKFMKDPVLLIGFLTAQLLDERYRNQVEREALSAAIELLRSVTLKNGGNK